MSRRPPRGAGPRWRPSAPPRAVVIFAASAVLLVACTGSAQPSPPTASPPEARVVAELITEEGLRARLDELAAVTISAPGYRSVGSPGYAAAAALVERELAASGWVVASDTQDDIAFIDGGGSSLEVSARTYGADDVRPLIFSPAGDASGPVALLETSAGATGTGCRPGDYATIPERAIVLVGPAQCLRRDQVLAAQQAGAAGFVAVYPTEPPGVVLRPTLLDPQGLTIPAVSVSAEAAAALVAAAATGSGAHLVTDAHSEAVPTRTVLAELPGSRQGPVVMLGAHLDSVIDGPGINDNASGVAALLEIARALGGTRPATTVRLAFWSGEEAGLHGSVRYVEALSQEQRDSLVVYANADMIASPNGYAGVYDESGTAAGSARATQLLSAAVSRNGGAPVPVDLHGGSDHYGFVRAAVPTAGVFSGYSEPVTEAQAAASGAEVGQPADRCYHQRCDDRANLDLGLARVLAAALAELTVEVAGDPGLLTR